MLLMMPGAEPTSKVMSLLAQVHPEASIEKVLIVSLGQGQEKCAVNCIARAQKAGLWVIL